MEILAGLYVNLKLLTQEIKYSVDNSEVDE